LDLAGIWKIHHSGDTLPRLVDENLDVKVPFSNQVGFHKKCYKYSKNEEMKTTILLTVLLILCFAGNTQNVGVGTSTPRARLHVADSSVLFTAPANLPVNAGNTPVVGPGHRMMWFANKAALRIGRTTGNQSDAAQIGQLSFAAGQDNMVSGFASAAFGTENKVSSGYNFAAGYGNETRSVTAAAFGFNNLVKAQHGFAIGLYNDTADNASPNVASTMDRLFQIGNGSSGNNRSNALTVLRNGNAGIGEVNPLLAGLVVNKKVGATNAIFGGNTTGVAIESSFPGIGFNNYFYNDGFRKAIANGYSGFIGVNPVDGGMQFWVSPFSAEAGTDVFIKSAVAIAPNGNVGIGLSDPAFILDVNGRVRLRSSFGNSSGIWMNNEENTGVSGFVGMRTDYEIGFYGAGWIFSVNTTSGDGYLKGALTQNSDARLKKDIVPLSNSLEAIQQLSGYSYHWKDASNSEEQIGLLAQEIQKVYPQLVKENEQGTLSVNYSGMVPVLLTAVKEQQKQLQQQKEELNELKKLVSQLIKTSK
jgi:hypothetical protein